MKKLKLSDIKINSFTTSISELNKKTVKGGLVERPQYPSFILDGQPMCYADTPLNEPPDYGLSLAGGENCWLRTREDDVFNCIRL